MFKNAFKNNLFLFAALTVTGTVSCAQDSVGGMFMNQGIQIDSPSNDVICKIRELTMREVEELFANEEVTEYTKAGLELKDSMNELDHTMTEYNKHKKPNDYHPTNYQGHKHASVAETAEYINMQNLHVDFQPIEVTITNSSGKQIVIPRDAYINTLAKAVVPLAKILKKYPNFKADKIACYFLATVFAMGAAFSVVLGCIGFPPAFIGAFLSGLFSYLIASRGNWAARLQKVVERLKTLSPKIYTNAGSFDVAQAGTYAVPAGATFREILIVHTPSVNTTNAMFAGQAKPTLQFMGMN